MNATQLLAHFDRLSEAPDAVPRLRRLILDLAVRGKLVEQDAGDEPATELLKRIQAEKTRLVSEGLRKKEKLLAFIDAEELPFPVPASWTWVRLQNITSYIQRGKSPIYATAEGLPVVSQKCVQWRGLDLSAARLITNESIKNYEEVRFLRENDLLWNSTGTGTIGRIVRVVAPSKSLVCDSHVTVVRCALVSAEYVRTWLASDHVYRTIEDRAAGATNQVELNSSMATFQVVPLPPLAEQHRIVAKVDELMALCDQLEAAQQERERRRDSLAVASLQRLNQPAAATTPEAQREHARFHLHHLPRLTTRPEHIKALRQTILNFAARGRLVSQNPSDEPADVLLERIAREKKRQLNVRKRLTPRQEAVVSENLQPFALPSGWSWMTMEEAARPGELITYGILKPVWVASGVPTVRVTEMKTGVIDVASLPKCDPVRASKFEKTKLAVGDLLISKDGTIGKTAFVPEGLAGGNITQHVIRFPISYALNRQYVRICIDAPFCQAWLSGETKGVALQGVNVGDFRRLPLPIPPLAEQHRIVAKVDELMALCDQLEAQLTTTETDSRRLLEVVLEAALAPA